MATPTRCAIYGAEGEFVPWNDQDSPQKLAPNFEITSGPNGSECPGASPALPPAPRGGHDDAGRRRLLELHPQARPRRRRPVPRRPQLHDAAGPDRPTCAGSATAPTRQIAAAAADPRPRRAGDPELPGRAPRSAPPTSPPAPAATRSTPSGRCTWPGRSRAPRSRSSRSPRRSPAPTTTARSSSASRSTSTRTTPTSIAVSDTVPSIIGGIPIRMRSIQVNIDRSKFMINPTNCDPFSVESQGIGDEGTVAELLLLLPGRQLHDARLQAEDDDPPARRAQGSTRRAQDPSLRFDLTTRPGDANIKSLAVTLPKAFEIDQAHLGNLCSKARAGSETLRRPPADRDREDRDAAARPAARRPGLRGLRLRRPAPRGLHPRRPGLAAPAVRSRRRSTAANSAPNVPVVPDAPIGHFRLTLFGGKRGYLTNTRSLCAGARPSRRSNTPARTASPTSSG